MTEIVEQLTPGEHYSYDVIQEHLNRYVFSGNYAKGKNILDVGCGSGYGTYYLSQSNALSIKGIDSKTESIEFAQSNYKNNNLTFENQSIELFSRSNQKFDLIICFEIIEHVENQIDFIKNCINNLSKNGVILFSTPNAEKNIILKTKNPFHKHEFFKNEFITLLKSFFSNVEIFSQPLPSKINQKVYHEIKMPIQIQKNSLDKEFAISSHTKNPSNFLLVCKKPKNIDEINLDLIKTKIHHLHNDELVKCLTNLFENENDNPLSLLLNIYHTRTDLQNSFPEVLLGNYENLIAWAKNTILKNSNDFSHQTLNKFSNWFSKDNFVTSVEYEKFLKKTEKIKDEKKELDKLIESLIEDNTGQKKEIESLTHESTGQKKEIESLKNSLALQFMKKLDKAFPDGSFRGKTKKIIIHSMMTISDKGFLNYLKQVSTKLKRKELHIIEPVYYQYEKEEEIDHITSEIKNFTYTPKISILMPVYNTKIDWFEAVINSLKKQSYSNWELCICDDKSSETFRDYLKKFTQDKRIKIHFSKTNQGIASSTNSALKLSSGEFVLLLDHDDELDPNTMYEVVKVLNSNQNLDFIYSDEDKIDENGKNVEPFYKPDFSIHLLRSLNFLIHVAVIRKTLVEKVGGFDKEFDGCQDYDLFLKILEHTNKIYHIKKILYHWRKSEGSGAQNALAKPDIYEKGSRTLQNHLNRLGISAKTSIGEGWGLYRVLYNIESKPYVDILIPTRQISFLKKCIKSIKSKTSWPNYRIWVLVNGKQDYDVIEILSEDCSELESITDKNTGLIGPSLSYNWSRMNNLGVDKTNSPYLIFLNDDTEIITSDWIENMIQYAQLKEVGVVGCMLLYPNGLIQHAGDYITPNGTGAHCFNKMSPKKFEINGFAKIVRETSAVTSACYMMRREVFEKLNGYDEFLRNFDDYDFCLRLKENGFKIIYTPYSKVTHHESPTRPQINDESMLKKLISKHPWAKRDPFYRYEWETMYEKL